MAVKPMQAVRFGQGDGNRGLAVPRILTKVFVLPGALPATAANWGVPFWIPVEGDVELVAVYERHTTAGADASAVTFMLKKVPDGTAPGSGTDMLSAGINLKATANTLQAGSLSATPANLRLTGSSDTVAAVLTGTPTSLAGVTITTVWKVI